MGLRSGGGFWLFLRNCVSLRHGTEVLALHSRFVAALVRLCGQAGTLSRAVAAGFTVSGSPSGQCIGLSGLVGCAFIRAFGRGKDVCGLAPHQGCDKLYMAHASDSAINRIVEFYERFGDCERLAEAYFYQGSVYRDLKDAPRAITALQAAAAQKSKNDTLNGRIYGQLASLFAYQGAYEESREATREACIYNIRCKNYKGLAYGYRDMARMFDKEAEKDSAEFYYREAYRVMKEKAEPKWTYGILSELSSFYQSNGEPDSAEVCARRVLAYAPDDVAQLTLAKVHYGRKQFDSVAFYCREALKSRSIYHRRTAYSLLVRTAEQVDSIRDYFSHYFALQDSVNEITRTEAVMQVHQRQVEQENARLALQSSRRISWIFGLVALVLMLTLLTAYLLYALRERRRRFALREQVWQRIHRELQEQSDRQLAENRQKIAELTNRLESLSEGKEQRNVWEQEVEALRSVNESILHTQKLDAARVTVLLHSEVYRFFHDASSGAKVSEEDWETLAHAVDEAYPHFTSRLKALCSGKFSQKAYRICYLVKIDVSRRRMSDLLYMSESGICSALTRLYKKIKGKEGSVKDMEELLRKL